MAYKKYAPPAPERKPTPQTPQSDDDRRRDKGNRVARLRDRIRSAAESLDEALRDHRFLQAKDYAHKLEDAAHEVQHFNDD